MKFARYLEETQTPEWKRAYIDYRGLKKRITAIRRKEQEEASLRRSSSSNLSLSSQTSRGHLISTLQPVDSNPTAVTSISSEPVSEPVLCSPTLVHSVTIADPSTEDNAAAEADTEGDGAPPARPDASRTLPTRRPLDPNKPSRPRRRLTMLERAVSFSQTLRRRSYLRRAPSERPDGSPGYDMHTPVPLMELLPLLSPEHREFFKKLDIELDKVESFYCDRERDMKQRCAVLKQQLQELKDHRRAFYATRPTAGQWLPFPLQSPLGLHQRHVPKAKKRADSDEEPSAASTIRGVPDGVGPSEENPKWEPRPPSDTAYLETPSSPLGITAPTSMHAFLQSLPLYNAMTKGSGSGTNTPRRVAHESHEHAGLKYSPDDYQHAKKQLKKAVLECYRGLELLNNYRTLNLIGFRKALKKYEKVAQVPAQIAYTREKIEPCAFSTGQPVDSMAREMEELFAARFARGDKKKAMARLRGGSKHTSHHFSAFRTGMALGLAVPALVSGIYESFQEDTRNDIPGWGGLLYIYAVFFVPTFFSLLVGTNLLVWARSRINFVFIFELDIRTKLDYREYFETPAYLLSLLCYAFWLSFSRISAGSVDAHTWPMVWLGIAGFITLNPLPILFKPSRWWLVKVIGRLLTAGMHRVEFADFWMGDQFCSLVFTLGNLYFVGCIYANGLDENWKTCTTARGPTWGVPFILAALPLLVRLVQSVKRWVDSGLITHLINGGKYGAGVLYYLFYYLWRREGGSHDTALFGVWCVAGIINSTYSGTWDLLMDWSVLQRHARYPFLRPELLYTSNIWFYYFAIVSNTLIRFIWVLYIPLGGPNFQLRTFIAAMLEIFRRWQWNFLRLENEHLGNIDQYRVTREVPLPYSFDVSHDSDGEDEDESPVRKASSRRNQRTRPIEEETGNVSE